MNDIMKKPITLIITMVIMPLIVLILFSAWTNREAKLEGSISKAEVTKTIEQVIIGYKAADAIIINTCAENKTHFEIELDGKADKNVVQMIYESQTETQKDINAIKLLLIEWNNNK